MATVITPLSLIAVGAAPTKVIVTMQAVDSTTGQPLGPTVTAPVTLTGPQQTAMANFLAAAAAKLQARIARAVTLRQSDPTAVVDLNEPAPGET